MKKRILAMFVAVVVIFGVIQTVTASNTTLQTPIITMQPVSANYLLNATPTSLSVDAYVTDGGALTYQWYSNPVNSNIGGIAIEGATNPSLIPSTTGTHDSYYYVVVTNTNGDNEPTLTTSNVAAIYFERELGKFNATSNWGYYAWYHLYSAGDFTHSNSGIELTFGMLRNAVELRIEFTEEPAGDIMFAYAFHSHPHIKIFGSGHGTSLVFNFSLPTLNWHEATSDNFGHIGTTLALMYSENHDLREIIESATLVYKGSSQICNPCEYISGSYRCNGCTNTNCTSNSHLRHCKGYPIAHVVGPGGGNNNRPGGGGSGSTPPAETPPAQTSPVTTPVQQASGTATLIVNIPRTALRAINSNIPIHQLKVNTAGTHTLNAGTELAGQNAVLVRFNETTNELEFVSAATVGANGNASLNITQTGDFLVLTFKTGDVTGTGEVTTSDALAVLRHVAGISELNSIQQFVANGKSGGVNTTDALAVLRHVAGISESKGER